MTPDDLDSGHGVPLGDNEDWKSQRMEWAQTMWDGRGAARILELVEKKNKKRKKK